MRLASLGTRQHKGKPKQSNICLFAVGTMSSHYCVMFHFFDFHMRLTILSSVYFPLIFLFYKLAHLCPLPICLLEYLLSCRSTVSIIYEMY